MSTFNGIGTSFFGESERNEDGSYISTKWVVRGYIPLIPIASYRIYSEYTDQTLFGQTKTTNYQERKIPLYWPQIRSIMLSIYLGISSLIFFIWLALTSSSQWFALISILGIISTMIMCLFRLFKIWEK